MKYFDEAYEFIIKYLSNKDNVYVHCEAGISRSPTIVIAYIMKAYKWSVLKSLVFVKTKRDVICPNLGFID